MSLELTYVLPLRWDEERDASEFTAYLHELAPVVELIVVDGSPQPLFARHAALWRDVARHLSPDPDVAFMNGKVDGVFTGVRRASHEAIVIADDDVRYRSEALGRVVQLLEQSDLVRPQNYFDPMPWHAVWDSARSLINRAIGRDFPGTLGFRRSFFLKMGGYDGDVMFENLELIRTVAAAGGREIAPLDLFVARMPPSTHGFWSQRVRQAFDDFAMPLRLVIFLSLFPLLVAAAIRRKDGALVGTAIASVAVAEAGRRRGGGDAVFPAATSACAPLWLLERAVCSWLAVASRVFYGGIRYRRGTIRMAATPMRRLRRRFGTGAPPAHPTP